MAEGKINRNNHPILVKARKASFDAGVNAGFKNGFAKGFEEGKTEGIRITTLPYRAKVSYLNAIVEGLAKRNEELISESYSEGVRDGYKAARQEIQDSVDEIKRHVVYLENMEVDS